MNVSHQQVAGMTRYRWVVCSMLFLATAINYMDRQVLSLTWKDFIAPEFGWNDTDYGLITGCFSIVYAIAMLVVGKFIDKVGARRGYLWAIGLWSAGACLHAFCGIATNGLLGGEWLTDFAGARQNLATLQTVGDGVWTVATVSVWLFLAARKFSGSHQDYGRVFSEKGPWVRYQCVQQRGTDRSLACSFRHTFAGSLLGLGDVLPLGGCRGLRLDGRLGVCV